MRVASVALLLAASFTASALATPLAEQQSFNAGPIRTTDSWDYKICSNSGDPVQIKSISVTPDPPQPGQDLTVKVQATVLNAIQEGAYADVVVKLGLVKLLQKRFDVCKEARNANATVQCPVEKGDYEVVQTVALPKEIPHAKFQVDVNGYTADDDDMLCVKLFVNFMKKPFFQAW